MKKTLITILILTCALSAVFFLTNCNNAPKKYVIGIINPRPPGDELINGFIDKLASYGYSEGKNLTLIKWEAEKVNIDSALEDIVKHKPNLILAVTTPVARKAKELSEKTGIPVVFAVFDPVNSKLVNAIRVPGNIITGLQLRGSVPKAVEWMVKIKPGTKKVFAPIVNDTEAAKQSAIDLAEIAPKFGIELLTREVGSQEELFQSISSLEQDFDAIFINHSILLSNNIKKIVELASAKKLIVVTSGSHYNRGALISYGVDRYHGGEQLSRIGHMILQGTDPKQIPVEIADFFLGINVKTATEIGLEIDNNILQLADFIAR